MSEREQGPQVEYDSPIAEYSEDASSAIGPVPETESSPALNYSNNASTQDVSVDSSQIGPVPENSMDSVTSATSAATTRHVPKRESEDQSQDADEEDTTESEEEDEDEESEDGEEEEPVLKYEKIGNDLVEKFEKDGASAIAVGPSYFAVGTHNGLVYLFSLSGTLLRRYRPHSATITDIAISSSLSEPPPQSVAIPQPTLPSFSLFPTSLPGTPRTSTPHNDGSSSEKKAPSEAPAVISDTIATASLDGQAILHSLATGTTTGHNFKRPLRTIALEPTYSSSTSKAYVCGGLAGELVLTSKSHLSLGGLENVFGGLGLGVGGGTQTQKVIHSGEGPIWTTRWDGDIIAWANDLGVRLYSVSRGERLAFIDRPRDSPRADLFQCSLRWIPNARTDSSAAAQTSFNDEQQLIIGWADLVKLVRISSRPRAAPSQSTSKETATGSLGIVGAAGLGAMAPAVQGTGVETVVEVTKVLRLDCMIAGVMPWPFDDVVEEKHENKEDVKQTTIVPTNATTAPISNTGSTSAPQPRNAAKPSRATSFLLLSYLPPKALLTSESTASRADQRRPNSNPPELQIVTSDGDERSSDVLAMKGYERWGCTDYRIVESFPPKPSLATMNRKAKERAGSAQSLKERDHGGWLVMSPNGVVWVRKRDKMDRVAWLVERERYEEALAEMERMEKEGDYLKSASGDGEVQIMSKDEIGRMYLSHLFKQKQYEKAAKLCPTVLASDGKAWEDWIFKFRYAEELSVLVPYIPFQTPRLSKVAYGVVLDYYLRHDVPALSRTIKEWPSEIYDIPALINAIPQPPQTTMLMECLADLYIKNRQPGKALPYFLRLRRPNVFQLIRENHLFTDVQDQALLLVEFDQELLKQREHVKATQQAEAPTRANTAATQSKASSPPAKGAHRRAATDSVGGSGGGGLFQTFFSAAAAVPTGVFGGGGSAKPSAPAPPKPVAAQPTRPVMTPHTHSSAWTSTAPGDTSDQTYVVARGEAIPLLVEYSHSIPIQKVVSQLEERPYFLFLYLDALFDKDPELIANYLERQVALYAEYRKGRVIRLLQSAQNLQIMLPFERIYKICEDKDMVPEMVWVRSRMGDNKGALFLIIDRLGDVSRAIDFAKERKDDDLWEDLLRYSESRPAFIKGLLENVSTEIDSDPVRIIRRIRNGLEIPGLKQSIIKILQDLNLQTSLMEGCGNVLQSDCEYLGRRLQRAQAGGLVGVATGVCPICTKPLHQASQDLVLAFLCGHVVHAHCTSGGSGLPKQADSSLVGIGLGVERDIGAKLAYAEMVKRRLDHGCPVHQKLEEGESSILQPPTLQSHHSHRHK